MFGRVVPRPVPLAVPTESTGMTVGDVGCYLQSAPYLHATRGVPGSPGPPAPQPLIGGGRGSGAQEGLAANTTPAALHPSDVPLVHSGTRNLPAVPGIGLHQ